MENPQIHSHFRTRFLSFLYYETGDGGGSGLESMSYGDVLKWGLFKTTKKINVYREKLKWKIPLQVYYSL